jgi:hypothetical protein
MIIVIQRKLTAIHIFLIKSPSLSQLREKIQRIGIILKLGCEIPDTPSFHCGISTGFDRARPSMELASALPNVISPPALMQLTLSLTLLFLGIAAHRYWSLAHGL